MFVQFGQRGVSMPYNPNYADESYSFEYGGYIDSKRGGRGRGGFFSRPPMGFRGRYVHFISDNASIVFVCDANKL